MDAEQSRISVGRLANHQDRSITLIGLDSEIRICLRELDGIDGQLATATDQNGISRLGVVNRLAQSRINIASPFSLGIEDLVLCANNRFGRPALERRQLLVVVGLPDA